MAIADLIRQRITPTSPLSAQDLVARYQRLRGVCKNLNNTMVPRLTKETLNEGGRPADSQLPGQAGDGAHCATGIRRRLRCVTRRWSVPPPSNGRRCSSIRRSRTPLAVVPVAAARCSRTAA